MSKNDVVVGRGKKVCPLCGNVLGARTMLCRGKDGKSCGYYFPTQKVRTAMLNEVIEKEAKGTKDLKKAGRGRKQCPKCGKFVGARARVCGGTCDHVFITEKTVYKPRAEKVEMAKVTEPVAETSVEPKTEAVVEVKADEKAVAKATKKAVSKAQAV